jgi:hypothetical protein
MEEQGGQCQSRLCKRKNSNQLVKIWRGRRKKGGQQLPPPPHTHTLQLSYAGSKKFVEDDFTNATLLNLFASGHTLKGLPTGKDCIKCPTLWSD